MSDRPQPWRVRWLLVIGVLTFLVILALDLYPGLRGGAGWHWRYDLPTSWLPVLVLATLLAIYTGGVLVLRRLPVAALLAWVVFGGTVLAYAVVGIRGDAGFLLFTRTVSPVQTGASAVAVGYFANDADGPMTTLENWPDVMDEARERNLIHFTTSPPGQPLIHYWLAELFDQPMLAGFSQPFSMALRPYQCADPNVMFYTRGEIVSAGLGLLMPLLAALGALPLYNASVTLSNRDTARRLVGWYALIPALLLFSPTWNTLYPTLCLLSFALLVQGLSRRRLWWLLPAGLVMSITTFLNLSVLPFFLLIGLFTLGYVWFVVGKPNLDGVRFSVRAGLWYGVGLLSLWGLYWLVSGVSPFEILSMTFTQHSDLVQRDYLPWLILHPYDVLTFAGWMLCALALWGMALALRRLIRRYDLNGVDVLALAMGATLLAVNLAGIVQGENARILIFYMPFLLLSAANVFRQGNMWDAPLLATQAITVLVMATVLSVVPLDLNPQPTAPRSDIATLDDDITWRDVNATYRSGAYTGEFSLDRYRFVTDPTQDAITFEFAWQGQSPTERPYSFELVAESSDGTVSISPHRWSPQNAAYLTPCWRDGETIHDVVVLPMPMLDASTIWTMGVRAVDVRTGDVMAVFLADDSLTNTAPLGDIAYP